jgi:hypothetical protein
MYRKSTGWYVSKKEGAKQSKTKQQWKNIIINSLYSI